MLYVNSDEPIEVLSTKDAKLHKDTQLIFQAQFQHLLIGLGPHNSKCTYENNTYSFFLFQNKWMKNPELVPILEIFWGKRRHTAQVWCRQIPGVSIVVDIAMLSVFHEPTKKMIYRFVPKEKKKLIR